MFENPTTPANREHVRFYGTDLLAMIHSKSLGASAPGPAPAPAPPPAPGTVPPPPPTAASCDWTWEETTHRSYSVGEQVEITGGFKPRYEAFIGSIAVVRKIFAKKMPDKYTAYIFFLEVQGKDADETAKISDTVKNHNSKCFTDFLRGDARSLLPCRLTHMHLFSRMRYEMAAAASAAAASAALNAAASNAADSGSKRACDDAGSNAASKMPRLEQQAAPTKEPPPETEIKLGDTVEILKTLYIMKEVTGYHGVVRRIAKRESFTSCWVEIQRTPHGLPMPPSLADEVRRKNRSFYTEPEMWLSWVCCRVENVVRTDRDPKLPDPWTHPAWAALPVSERKMHRQKQQQDKDKTSSSFDMLLDAALAMRDKIPTKSRDIAIGDNVEIRKIIGIDWYPASFIGFQGVVRSVQKNLFHTTCFVELTHNPTGAPVTPEQTKTIQEWNKGTCTPDERSFMKCNMEYVVLAGPKLPSPDKEAQTQSAPAPSSKIHRHPARHRKYNPAASPPWRGGDVKPFLYGRKITFILGGTRGDPIAR